MSFDPISVDVQMDAWIFRQFAWFDTFRRQRRWVSPLLFAAIMLVFSAICFTQVGKKEQAALLGGILLAVGLILPIGWVLSFFLSVRGQIQKMSLKRPRYAYTVELAADKVRVSTEKQHASYAWKKLHGAYRVKGCTYLYVSPRQAYLLPSTQMDSDALWAVLERTLPAEKRFDCR